MDHAFYGFTFVITHLGCWENTRKACKSRAEDEWFTSFPRFLKTSQVGYHADRPIESVVFWSSNFRLKSYKLMMIRDKVAIMAVGGPECGYLD